MDSTSGGLFFLNDCPVLSGQTYRRRAQALADRLAPKTALAYKDSLPSRVRLASHLSQMKPDRRIRWESVRWDAGAAGRDISRLGRSGQLVLVVDGLRLWSHRPIGASPAGPAETGEAGLPFSVTIGSDLGAKRILGLGQKEEAIALLQKAYAEHSSLTTLKVNPAYDPLRSDARFQELLRRVGLAQ